MIDDKLIKKAQRLLAEQRAVQDRLICIHRARMKVQRPFVLRKKGVRGITYVSGMMYLVTAFPERAFVFASRDQARRLVKRFPNALRGYKPTRFRV